MRELVVGHGADPDSVRVLPHGVDTSSFVPAPQPLTTQPLRLGFVGRLEPRKGIRFIWRVIHALAPKGSVSFHLKGAVHPAVSAELRDILARYPTAVFHQGPGDHADMPAFYQGLHALLLPSLFESFGLAYVEAMACGLVVFAGDAGGSRDIIVHGRNGFLVDGGGSENEVVAVLREMTEDPDKFAVLRGEARRTAEERFSVTRWVEEKLAVFRAVASEQENPTRLE
jgi:glycosyltransferase involved in cell wall biosynthesis